MRMRITGPAGSDKRCTRPAIETETLVDCTHKALQRPSYSNLWERHLSSIRILCQEVGLRTSRKRIKACSMLHWNANTDATSKGGTQVNVCPTGTPATTIPVLESNHGFIQGCHCWLAQQCCFIPIRLSRTVIIVAGASVPPYSSVLKLTAIKRLVSGQGVCP